MIKTLKTLIIFFLSIFFLTGCANKNNGINIRFSTWGTASEIKILKPIIKEYEDKNPGVKIELIHIPQDYFKKLHLLFASNLEPDVIFINNLNLPVYSSRLEDLSNIISVSDYYKQALDSMSVDAKIYAVPRDISVLVVYYNKDFFDYYGEKYPSKNWVYSDLINISRNLTKQGKYGISFEPQVYYALPFIRTFNGDILNSKKEYIADKKEFLEGIKKYKDIVYMYNYAPTPAQRGSKTSAQLFLEGKIAMHLSGRWLVPKYRESANFRWDVVNFPRCSAPTDASGWAVSKNSKNKKEAIKFIQFLSAKTNIEKMTKSGLIIPARIDVAENSLFLNGEPKHTELFLYAIKNSNSTIVNKDYSKIIDILNDKFFNE